MPYDHPPAMPLRYDPSVETLEADEAQTTHELVETLRKISAKTYEDGGVGLRSVHAKGHGIVQGELEVLSGLPSVLAQGLFAKPGRYPAVMRFSTTPGDILDDSVSTPRGLGLKIIDVEGERLGGSEADTTQDFLMVNGPAFNARDAKHFLSSLKLLAATTDSAEGLKKALSALFRGAESLVEAVGGKSATLISLGGHPETHILGESFFTQTAYRYGDYIAKLVLVPVAPALTALTGAPLQVNGVPNALRQAVTAFFRDQGGVWELRVQLCTDLDDMPVEDATVPWPEDKSPYVAVARLTAGPQPSWDLARATDGEKGLSFNPWHGLVAHCPLGSINRVRRQAYPMSAQFRASRDGRALEEPRGGCPFAD
jgi:hypothetical protein